jgi:hypothetical protein
MPPHHSAPPTTLDENASARQCAQSLSEQIIRQGGRESRTNAFTYPPQKPIVFIKFGWSKQKLAEAQMQILAFDFFRQERQRDPSCNIYVPEVFRVCQYGTATYILMELVTATPFLGFADTLLNEPDKTRRYDMMADGVVRMLHGVPLPSDATLGPYSPGAGTDMLPRIRHMFFKDQEAPVTYPNVSELEAHINRVCLAEVAKRPNYRNKPAPLVTLDTQLRFCYTDFNNQNFMFDTTADRRLRMHIVDFEHASFLPIDFLAYVVLANNRWRLSSVLGEKLKFSDKYVTNMEGMKQVSQILAVLPTRAGNPVGEK